MAEFITRGDRVVVVNAAYHGQAGIVESEDGWGFCQVKLDTGEVISAWNGRDLIREGEPLGEPVNDGGFMTPGQSGVLVFREMGVVQMKAPEKEAGDSSPLQE